jgi:hypothetical protein
LRRYVEVALERNTEPHIMALLLPDYWVGELNNAHEEGDGFQLYRRVASGVGSLPIYTRVC